MEQKKKKKELTVTLYVDGKQVETLTEAQRQVVADRFSEALSRYYSRHPEEYLKIRP